MKVSILILFSFIFTDLSASAQVVFENLYQENSAYAGYDIKPTSDNGYIITGFCNPTGSLFGQDILLIKVDSLGQVEWANSFGDGSSDYGQSVIQTSDGGFLAVGVLNSFTTSSDDIYLVKTDASGNFLWDKIYGDLSDEFAGDVIEIPTDSGFALVGKKDEYHYLMRTDKFGDSLWTKTYSDTGNLNSISLTSDGGFIVSGSHYGTISGTLALRGYLMRTDSNANITWAKLFDGGGGERLYDSFELSSGEFAVIGESLEDSPPPKTDGILRIIDSNGNLVWHETYGTTDTEYFYGISPTFDGGFIMVGTNYLTTGGDYHGQIYLVKANSTGGVLWEKDFGEVFPGSEYGYAVCQASDGGYVACGQRTLNGEAYLYLVKCDEYGSTVNILEMPQLNDFSIYPNPFQHEATIAFPHLLENDVTIDIYDLNGKNVFSSKLVAGDDSYQLLRNDLSTGTYILGIRMNQRIISKKIIIN